MDFQAYYPIVEIVPPVKDKDILKVTWLEHIFLEKGSGVLLDPMKLSRSAIMTLAMSRVKKYLKIVMSKLGEVNLIGIPQL